MLIINLKINKCSECLSIKKKKQLRTYNKTEPVAGINKR